MADTRLSFTMQASVGRGPAPPSRYGDGPLPPGCVRIPVTVQVALPPGAAGLDDVVKGAALPVTVGAAPGAAPGPDVRRLGPATGWPVTRKRSGGRTLSVEAKQRVLNSLFAGAGNAQTPGAGTGNGAGGGGMRAGKLAAVLPVPSAGGAEPARAPKPDAPDPGSEAFLAADASGPVKPLIPGLPAAVLWD